MTRPSFILFPAVDISDGRCVRPLQGRFGRETVYSDDPVEVALAFCRAGARWLHIVDIDGARTGEPTNRDALLEVIRLASCPVQAGGGLRTIDDVEQVLAAGAQRAVVSTFALEDAGELRKAGKRYGERSVASIDARGADGEAHEWTVGRGDPVLDAVATFRDAGVSQFIYRDADRDGSLSGPNLTALVRLTEATDRPVIASGGISSLADVRAVAALRDTGVGGAIVGRAFYEGKFTLEEAIRAGDGVDGADGPARDRQ